MRAVDVADAPASRPGTVLEVFRAGYPPTAGCSASPRSRSPADRRPTQESTDG